MEADSGPIETAERREWSCLIQRRQTRSCKKGRTIHAAVEGAHVFPSLQGLITNHFHFDLPTSALAFATPSACCRVFCAFCCAAFPFDDAILFSHAFL